MEEYIQKLPKAELHVHIEGTLEPELMFKLANKNHIKLAFSDISAVKKAYQFQNLQSFLDIYYLGTQVLKDEDDFFELAWVYFTKAADQNIKHAEIFFDPQTHLARGISFNTVIHGLIKAIEKAKTELDISSYLIMCFLRDKPVADTFVLLEQALAYQDKIIGIGLDSAEVGYPPSLFQDVFSRARELGFKCVAHAGEEGPPEYIWQAIKLLKVERIDHGIRCLEDEQLVAYLHKTQLPLTVCPLSNVKLKAVASLAKHPLKSMLEKKLCVTVNSDDPAYFQGYLTENLTESAQYLHLSHCEVLQLIRNSFVASFLPQDQKQQFLRETLRSQ